MTPQQVYLLCGAACLLVATLVLAIRFGGVVVRRRRRRKALMPILSLNQETLIRQPAEPQIDPRHLEQVAHVRTPWKKRALDAERRAAKANAILRSELTPHLAKMMKDRLVITLLSQRARLLQHNQARTEQVAALEHRLTGLQLRLQRQTRAYEVRIQELEKELSAKDRLTRELLKVKVKLTKQALEAVRLSPTAN